MYIKYKKMYHVSNKIHVKNKKTGNIPVFIFCFVRLEGW